MLACEVLLDKNIAKQVNKSLIFCCISYYSFGQVDLKFKISVRKEQKDNPAGHRTVSNSSRTTRRRYKRTITSA